MVRYKRKPTDDWLDVAWGTISPVALMAILIAAFLVIPVGTLSLTVLGFLRTGAWSWATLGSLTGYQFQSEWLGFNDVANWVLGQWIGWSSMITGWVVLQMWPKDLWGDRR